MAMEAEHIDGVEKRKPGRPAANGRARAMTRERLVRCGVELLTEKGFASTGIDEVLKRVGVPKGSFYHYFSSKDEFGQAVVDGYARYIANKLDRCLLDETATPLQRLRNYVEDGKRGMARYDFRRGCLIGNLGQELGATNDCYREALEAVFLDWQARVATCLELAKTGGELSEDADPDSPAAFFWIGWEGAILRAKLTRSNNPIDLFADAYFAGLPR